jgi:nematocidal protein AidA
MENLLNDNTITINMLIVFDTALIVKNCTKPSLDKTMPKVVKSNSQYVLCSGVRDIISGQGTAKLSILGCPNDIIKFRGTSIYQDSEDSVIIYQIKNLNGNDINDQFTPNPVTRDNAVQPDPDSASYDGLPALKTKENFMSMDSKIQGSGKRNYRVFFTLYRLADDGETQNLYGYFYWDFKLRIFQKEN